MSQPKPSPKQPESSYRIRRTIIRVWSWLGAHSNHLVALLTLATLLVGYFTWSSSRRLELLKHYREISKAFYENDAAHLLYTTDAKQRGEHIKGKAQYENLKSLERELRDSLWSADYYVLARGALFTADAESFAYFCDTAVAKSADESRSTRIATRIEIAALVSEFSPERNWKKAESLFDEAMTLLDAVSTQEQRWVMRHKAKLHFERAMHFTRRFDLERADTEVQAACHTPAFDSLDQAKWSISVRVMVRNAQVRFGLVTGTLPAEEGYQWKSEKGANGKANWILEPVAPKKP